MNNEDEKTVEEIAFDKAAHKYLMDNQDSTIKESVTELIGDWALDAFNAGWDARCTDLGNQHKEAINGQNSSQIFTSGDGSAAEHKRDEIAKLNAASEYVENGNGIDSLEDFDTGFDFGVAHGLTSNNSNVNPDTIKRFERWATIYSEATDEIKRLQKRIDELERALCNVIFRTDQYKYAVYDQYYGCDDAEDAIDFLIAETNQALTPKEKEE